MNEAAMTERLDERGLLDDARNPGVYALALAVPSALDAVRRDWDAVADHRPPDDALARLASADRVAYVGASSNVYARLCDHAAGDVRTASICEAFPPDGVIDIWPDESPFMAEYNRALALSRTGWRVWCDGVIFG